MDIKYFLEISFFDGTRAEHKNISSTQLSDIKTEFFDETCWVKLPTRKYGSGYYVNKKHIKSWYYRELENEVD
jgi:hypothetical protein